MPVAEVAVDSFKLAFRSLDDWLSFVNNTVVPTGAQYGYKVTVEPIPKTETAVDRV